MKLNLVKDKSSSTIGFKLKPQTDKLFMPSIIGRDSLVRGSFISMDPLTKETSIEIYSVESGTRNQED